MLTDGTRNVGSDQWPNSDVIKSMHKYLKRRNFLTQYMPGQYKKIKSDAIKYHLWKSITWKSNIYRSDCYRFIAISDLALQTEVLKVQKMRVTCKKNQVFSSEMDRGSKKFWKTFYAIQVPFPARRASEKNGIKCARLGDISLQTYSYVYTWHAVL